MEQPTPSKIIELSELTLRVGKKGQIFTSAELRKKANIKEGGKVKARVVDNKLVIESIPSLDELLSQAGREDDNQRG